MLNAIKHNEMSKTRKGSDVDSSGDNTGVYPRTVALAFVQN
jgi:hypothetical protein